MSRGRAGLGLIELLVSVALLGVLFTVLHSGDLALRKSVRELERRSRAVFMSQEFLELTCSELATIAPRAWQAQVFSRDGITGNVTVRPVARFPGVREVTLVVTWVGADGPGHRLVLSRLVPDRVVP